MKKQLIPALIIFAAALTISGVVVVEGIIGPIIDMFETLPQVAWFYVWTALSWIAAVVILKIGFGIATDLLK